MKKMFIFTVLLSTFYLLLSATAYAQSPTTEQKEGLTGKINDLKDRIASRVAQLNLVEKRGVMGTVTDVSNTQISISDTNSNTRFVDVDELTKFASPSSKESFGISDIKKGDRLGVLGLYNKQSRRILARFIEIVIMPKVVHGRVQSIDTKAFTIVVAPLKTDTVTVEVENVTKTTSYTKEVGVVKSGFSKIAVGDRVVAIGFLDVKDSSKLIASRLIVLPEIGGVQPTSIPTNAVQNNPIVPSTGSGKTLTPIKQ